VIWYVGCFWHASCKVKVPIYGISSHDSRVPSGFLHGARHQNGCPRNDAATRKSLFANELLRPDAKREVPAKRTYHGQYGSVDAAAGWLSWSSFGRALSNPKHQPNQLTPILPRLGQRLRQSTPLGARSQTHKPNTSWHKVQNPAEDHPTPPT
jgi:hypothetical protein